MDLNDIVVFCEGRRDQELHGRGRRARRLPRSTVSRKLAQLEERLGVRLVQRTTRKLALTEIGEAYYVRCSRIVSDVLAAEQLVTDMQATPRGPALRITSSVDFSTLYLGGIVAEFLALHPEDQRRDRSDRSSLVDLIEDGYDLAIRFGQMPESTLIARRLCSISLLLVAAPGYLVRGVPKRRSKRLDSYDHCCSRRSSRNQTWMLYSGDQAHEFGRPARFASNNYGAVREVVTRRRWHRAALRLHDRARSRIGHLLLLRVARVADASDGGSTRSIRRPRPCRRAAARCFSIISRRRSFSPPWAR